MKGKFNFNKWIRSKSGMWSMVGLVAVLIIAAIIIGQAGTLFGTAGLPTFPKPARGYTCLPTCEDTDGRMFALPGNGVASFGGQEVWVWVAVPGDVSDFTLDIFDGDGGGNWDQGTVNTNFTLYADPVFSGNTSTVLANWSSNDLLNNAWSSHMVQNDAAAKGPNGGYFYLLRVTRTSETIGENTFKVRSSGFLSTGASDLASSTMGITAALGKVADLRYYFPNFVSLSNPGVTVYDGTWNFKFFVPSKQTKIDIWDGDFDRGTSNDNSADSDDPNTIGQPEWAVSATVDERAGLAGKPADNNSAAYLRIGDPVSYILQNPSGAPLYVNSNPSGTEEWERFVLSTQGNECTSGTNDVACVDMTVADIEPGFYNLTITGLDIHNFIWLRVNFPICDEEEGCGFTPWTENRCPRTIGYWKNNFRKNLDPKDPAKAERGSQETQNGLNEGLKYIALASKIFRGSMVSGTEINVADYSGQNPTPLTYQQAYDILDRKSNHYFSNLDNKTMLARALQQNLATWLNLVTNKIGANSVVSIPLPDGAFEGSLIEALQEAERLILEGMQSGDKNDPMLERAKNIADYINNNKFSAEDDKSEDDPNALSCSVYEGGSVPKDKQPPKIKDMPKAPKPTPAPTEPPAEPVCEVPDYNLTGDYAIIALDPEPCLGEQNGLLFHGTSLTEIDGTAYSAGCLRSVGTTDVYSTAPIDYVGELAGNSTDFDNLHGGIQQIPEPLPESAWKQPEPNCSDPAAFQMDGKDFKGDTFLTEGLYCISGDVTINASDTVIGSGVTLYMIDGSFTINGGATVQLTAPGANASPSVPGVFLYVPESNGSVVKINGNSDSFFSGILYAPKSEVEVLGTGYVFGYQAQFVGWDVRIGGTADVILDWRSNGEGVCK